MEHIEEAGPDARWDVKPYLRAARSGVWVYERRELSGRDRGEPTRYVRRIAADRLSEGTLVGRDFAALDEYLELERTPTGSEQARRQRPRAPMEENTGLFIRLGEPLAVIPEGMRYGETLSATSPFHYYDERGRLAASGTLTRIVEIEGFEDVTATAGRFERCMRARIELQVRIPWIMDLDLTTYLWISAEVGEVRRVHRLSGWFVIFWFRSAHEYDLVSSTPDPPDEAEKPLVPAWSVGALQFERVLPRPQIAGMLIDFAPATAPAP